MYSYPRKRGLDDVEVLDLVTDRVLSMKFSTTYLLTYLRELTSTERDKGGGRYWVDRDPEMDIPHRKVGKVKERSGTYVRVYQGDLGLVGRGSTTGRVK